MNFLYQLRVTFRAYTSCALQRTLASPRPMNFVPIDLGKFRKARAKRPPCRFLYLHFFHIGYSVPVSSACRSKTAALRIPHHSQLTRARHKRTCHET